MRVSTGQLYQQTIARLHRQQSSLQETEQQIAAGLRILKPSDDPAGAARIQHLESNIAALDQFARNSSLAEASLGIEENTLQGVNNTLQRIRELTVQSNNATLSEADRLSIATEVEQRLEQLLSLANSRDGNGEYIFSGYRVDTTPFIRAGDSVSYEGDDGQRMLQIGEGAQVAVRDTGREVFQAIPDGSDGRGDLFSMVQSITDALRRPLSDSTDTELLHQDLATGLGQLDQALDHMNNRRAEVGARLNNLESMREINADFKLQLQTVRSQTQDLDYADAISRFNQQLTTLQAAQQVFVKASGLSLFQYL